MRHPWQDVKVSEHFALSEFACGQTIDGEFHPHCGYVFFSQELVRKLEELRKALGGHPLIITSGYRCDEKHAATPGAAPGSRHRYGDGVDIRTRGMPWTLEEAEKAAREIGFTGIGLYHDHLHVDTRPMPPGRVAFWDYR